MGRRRLLPNINTLLLQLHLPHRSGSRVNHSSTKNEASDHHEDRDDGIDDHHHHVVYGDGKPPASQESLVGSCHSRFSTKSAVSFGNCEIRTYPQVLGDHPCCSDGIPIQLGWFHVSEESYRIDDYDSNNDPHRNHHTVLQEIRLTPEERRSILILSKQRLKDCGNTGPVAEGSDGGEDSSLSDLHQQHERELMRECRRLHRCGGWNVNVKASRKRNKRTQEAFFGCPINKETIIKTPPKEDDAIQ